MKGCIHDSAHTCDGFSGGPEDEAATAATAARIYACQLYDSRLLVSYVCAYVYVCTR